MEDTRFVAARLARYSTSVLYLRSLRRPCLTVLPACPVPRPGFLNVPRVRLGIVKAVCVFPAPWPLRAAMAPWSPVTVGPPWPFGALCAGQSSVNHVVATHEVA